MVSSTHEKTAIPCPVLQPSLANFSIDLSQLSKLQADGRITITSRTVNEKRNDDVGQSYTCFYVPG